MVSNMCKGRIKASHIRKAVVNNYNQICHSVDAICSLANLAFKVIELALGRATHQAPRLTMPYPMSITTGIQSLCDARLSCMKYRRGSLGPKSLSTF
jgi:hypothetical protein